MVIIWFFGTKNDTTENSYVDQETWRLSVKVGDLVRFINPDFQESYGIGIITGAPQPGVPLGDARGAYFDIPVYFKDEVIYAREEELEMLNENR